jgi:hypothetical protein
MFPFTSMDRLDVDEKALRYGHGIGYLEKLSSQPAASFHLKRVTNVVQGHKRLHPGKLIPRAESARRRRMA